MNISIRLFILIILILGHNQSLSAQHMLRASGDRIVNENQDTVLLRGMGLGGWMLQEGYMLQTAAFANPQHQIRALIEELIGPEDTEAFYEAWLANHVRKTDIDSLKSWGFNSVRLPMHYNLFTLPIEEETIQGENTWLEKGFVLTDSLVSWCKQNQMYVILDLHAAPGGQGMDAGISDYDPDKPSLWESAENRAKTVALWRKLAERYADEQWVAGYDLINEPNWSLPGNSALKSLYINITNAIREVDTAHIIFIEGNWFANDFTGLTPPWDDNIVYSPHKYWSFNDQASIKWVLDLRAEYNVPLYFGESGENSNVWFRDAIRLFEDNDIGWAWWPMKKIESIAGPLSVIKTTEYQALLDYWEGTGPKPDAEFARDALIEIAEGLKTENCIYQKDVIDAMFRQVYSDDAIAYRTQEIPGIVYASEFDMGVLGSAYFDSEVANYQVSTGNYTSWNNGWLYRNDGVDLEICTDTMNTNGINIGWIGTGEWMQYAVKVASSAVYDINLRVAAGSSGGKFHLEMNGADLMQSQIIPGSGDWQNWQTYTVTDVVLGPDDSKLRFYVENEGFNLSSLEFVEVGSTNAIPVKFISASTVNEKLIQVNVNKYLAEPMPAAPGGFEIYINGNNVSVTDLTISPENLRIIYLSVGEQMKWDDEIEISYTGTDISAEDGSSLNTFLLEEVQNTLTAVHIIPGRIEAEDFVFQVGTQLETTSDIGGGYNIAYLDPGDYLDYEVDVANSGNYRVDFRIASQDASGSLQLQQINTNGEMTVLSTPVFPQTGGWQDWTTATTFIQLDEGRQKLRIMITEAPFNLNWMEFSNSTSTTEPTKVIKAIRCYPNPVYDVINLKTEFEDLLTYQIEIRNIFGQQVYSEIMSDALAGDRILVDHLAEGWYTLQIRLEDGSVFSEKFIKAAGN